MTIDKNTWQKLTKKYPTRAAWARGLNDLVWGEHEELYSALLELAPADLATEENPSITWSSDNSPVARLDTSKIQNSTDKAQEALDRAAEALNAAYDAANKVESLLADRAEIQAVHAETQAASDEALAHLEAKLTDTVKPNTEVHLHFNNPHLADDEEIIKVINRELGRGV